jgi:hypothetical protein
VVKAYEAHSPPQTRALIAVFWVDYHAQDSLLLYHILLILTYIIVVIVIATMETMATTLAMII